MMGQKLSPAFHRKLMQTSLTESYLTFMEVSSATGPKNAISFLIIDLDIIDRIWSHSQAPVYEKLSKHLTYADGRLNKVVQEYLMSFLIDCYGFYAMAYERFPLFKKTLALKAAEASQYIFESSNPLGVTGSSKRRYESDLSEAWRKTSKEWLDKASPLGRSVTSLQNRMQSSLSIQPTGTPD